ncbi:VanZ family protein [uncultured Marinobacter sp.]|uniref:VanZ family protein n=1 Tax=uncultured Marinobacter sp. TaxID=187379 RepID=UPI00258B32B7|nr:VanZ family protein [uncultured Marinobacter sp.]
MTRLWPTIRHILHMRRLWQAVLLVSVVAILYLATTSSSYPIPSSDNDKINHLIAFLELTIVTRLAWPRLSAIWYTPALLGFGLLLEVVQANLPYRDFSLADVLADGLGIAIGMLPWPGTRRPREIDLRDSPESL